MPFSPTNPFKGRHVPGDVILTAVRWYLRHPLAYLHVSELLAERGLFVHASCNLVVGAGIRAGVEQAAPAASEDHKQELPH